MIRGSYIVCDDVIQKVPFKNMSIFNDLFLIRCGLLPTFVFMFVNFVNKNFLRLRTHIDLQAFSPRCICSLY